MPLGDQRARQQIESALDATLVVEAAAGTGKTTELVKRILRVIGEGKAEVTTIVAVTFTERAAGELKLRLREELERARQTAERAASRSRFEDALKNLEEAHVSTIPRFCADLLRERPVEAGIDPLFTVLTEGRARRCYDEAFAGWFQDVLKNAPEGVRRSLRRSSRPTAGGDPDEDGPVERLRRAGWDLAEWRDFTASWSRPPFDRERTIDALATEIAAFVRLTSSPAKPNDPLFLDTAAARRADDDLRALIAAADYDSAEGIVVDLRRDRDFRRARKGYGSTFGTGVPRASVHAAHQALLELARRFCDGCRCGSRRAAARRPAGQHRGVLPAQVSRRCARLPRPAAATRETSCATTTTCVASFRCGSSVFLSTSFRTPILCRQRS
jgi:hypothetical protein